MNKRTQVISCILVLLFLHTTGKLFADDLKFTHITKDDGLSNHTITAILKDSKGFMWFGTYEGLNLYDGYTIKTFYKNELNPHSLSYNNVNCIFEDSSGNIWIGTTGGGINIYNRSTQKFKAFTHDINNSKSISSNSVFAIKEDKHGNLWVATGSGLNKFDIKTGEFIHYQTDAQNPNSLPHDYITDLEFDKNENLWIATYGGGISVLDIKSGVFTNFQKNINKLNDNEIWDIYIDSKGMIWIGTANGGLNFFNPVSGEFKIYNQFPKSHKNLFNTNVVYITEDIYQNLWFATDRGGLYKIDKEGRFTAIMNDPTRKESLSSNALTKLFCDEEGVLWIGTYDSGINKANLNQMKFQHIRNKFKNQNSLSDNNVNAILEDKKGNIWIGTENGLNLTNKNFETFQHFYPASSPTNKLPSDNVTLTIIEDFDDNIWFGGYTEGISILSSKSSTFSNIKNNGKDTNSLNSNFVRCIYQTSDSNIWIGTVRGGLDKYDYKTGKIKHYPYVWEPDKLLNSTNVMDITEADGKLYLATFGGGINVLDLQTDSFTYYTYNKNDSLTISDNQVITLFVDSDENLWAGTNSGLNLFNSQNGTFKRYYENNGLVNNSVMSILEDDEGNLWVSTTDGISKFNRKTEEFTNFFKEDGLQDNVFVFNSSTKLSNGMLAFGGVNGLSIFDPKVVTTKRQTPEVFFTGLSLYNKPVVVGKDEDGRVILTEGIYETDEIYLNYDDKLFTIEFSTLTYYSTKKIKFSYRLSKNDSWTDLANNNYITFHNLKPGNYNLEVRTVSHDGKSFGKINAISIVIIPPYWSTWWFRIILFFIIISILLGYNYFRIRSIKKQRELLEIKVFEKTIELRNTNSTLKDQKLELETQNEEISSQRDFAETQRKEIEKQNEELELYRNHLEKLIDDRTKDLVIAKEKAEEADRLKSAFIANMSHEIRTPMNGIIGFLDLIDEPELPESKRTEFKNHIANSSQKLLTLINDLIDISKIEAKQLSLNKKEIYLNETLNDFKGRYERKIIEKGKKIQLVFENYNKNGLTILTDEIRFNQVITNLLDNAVKFTEEGIISFGYKKKAEKVLFFIKDTGVGVEKDDLELIFDRFRKINSKSKKLYAGTGLGLAICKELLELMDGEIWVESEINKGSCFYFSLPLK